MTKPMTDERCSLLAGDVCESLRRLREEQEKAREEYQYVADKWAKADDEITKLRKEAEGLHKVVDAALFYYNRAGYIPAEVLKEMKALRELDEGEK